MKRVENGVKNDLLQLISTDSELKQCMHASHSMTKWKQLPDEIKNTIFYWFGFSKDLG